MSTATLPPVLMPYAPAAANCPICGRTLIDKKQKLLYGVPVCKKCLHSFANRRQFAWIIDYVLYYLLATAFFALIGFITALSMPSVRASIASSGTLPPGVELTLTLMSFVFWFGFLGKDGFSGRSPGKAICGVRVIDATTREPIGFGRSFKRNLPTLVPFGILIMAVQLIKGARWGDRWTNSMVVWSRYQHCLPFDQRGLFCPKCGYDLTGNESGRCPECGTGVPSRLPAAAPVSFDFARAPRA